MARTTSHVLPPARTIAALGLGLALALSTALPASADIVIDGPVNLGRAGTYAVLAGSAITNTGASVVVGDVGLSPGTSVTGFDVGGGPGVIVGGVRHVDDEPAALAKDDLTTAYGVAASLTPMEQNITELSGRSLLPGVYSGGAVGLSDNGALAFAGSARSVWVIQAASTLTIGSGTTMTFSGGASACNVFWQVGSSASIGTGAQFRGTILAEESITATDGAVIIGRLLARTSAVTLINDAVTVPQDCPAAGTPSETVAPSITSGAPGAGTVGTPYSFTVTATGNPAPGYTITSGALPAGLSLDAVSGVVSGTPVAAGTTTFTVTADNGQSPASSQDASITVAEEAATPGGPGGPGAPGGPVAPGGPGMPDASDVLGETLAATGDEGAPIALAGGAAILAGVLLTIVAARRRATTR